MSTDEPAVNRSTDTPESVTAPAVATGCYEQSRVTEQHRSLVRCDGCSRSYVMNTTASGKEYLVGVSGDACTGCEGTALTEITPGSLGMGETPARG